ncbi:WD40 repeat domain-containing protein [Nocardia abscessus]|uniref:WD40 repeat domain-containing protein n=1 Tax=Nocardia abscessus TaxID=120957 RepID=UPI002456D335|nr:hypothetical protein [Nocardia abscessus]
MLEVAFSPDGTRLASASDDNTMRLWDPATGKPVGDPLTGHTDLVEGLAFSREQYGPWYSTAPTPARSRTTSAGICEGTR